MKIISSSFGLTSKGEQTTLYTLSNANGMTASISDYGGTIQSIILPTADGPVDVVLGFDSVTGYEENAGACFGALVGPVANRISNASFELNNETFSVEQNFGDHCLHSGSINFSHRILASKTETLDSEVRLILTIMSPDGEGGLPGNLSVNSPTRSQIITSYASITQLLQIATPSSISPIIRTSIWLDRVLHSITKSKFTHRKFSKLLIGACPRVSSAISPARPLISLRLRPSVIISKMITIYSSLVAGMITATYFIKTLKNVMSPPSPSRTRVVV